MQEIEKKFLIKNIPEELEKFKKIRIEQGYLNTFGNPTLRIRKYGNEYLLTYKSKIESTLNSAKICREEELPISEEAYFHLKTKIDGQMIEKWRYFIELENNLIAELDIFDGYLKGLKFVEVEFKKEEDSVSFNPPIWFGKDVTFDYRFRNSYLSSVSNINEILGGIL